ncbi:MAG: transglutaminase domain-containing protein [Huintestinicola sp.]
MKKKDTPYIIATTVLAAAAMIILALLYGSTYSPEKYRTETPSSTGNAVYSISPEASQTSSPKCFDEGLDLPDSVAFESGVPFTTPYGTFTPIDKILDTNSYMTCNPVRLSAEQSLCYITPDLDKERAAEIMAQINALAEEICAGLTSDIEKVKAIAMWTGTNIAYDFDAAADCVDLTVTSLDAIISNGYKTTCAGFSNFFSALCHCSGIYSLNFVGGTSSEGWSRSQLEDAPANHCWNAVLIDDIWYYSDPTWISDLGVENGVTTGGEQLLDFYALFGFEEMSIEHRIDRSEHRCYSTDFSD